MKGLEAGKDKIQKICDALRKETLEPAQQEAREIIENAHLQASDIIEAAKNLAKATKEGIEQEIEGMKQVFHSSLQMACRQGIERLKQEIEEKLFHQELVDLVVREMGDPKTISHILTAFLQMIEERGIEDDLTVQIPKSISPRSISSLLVEKGLQHLKEHEISVGDFSGGVQIQFKGRKITVDISDQAVRELIALYIRRDFRDLVFGV